MPGARLARPLVAVVTLVLMIGLVVGRAQAGAPS